MIANASDPNILVPYHERAQRNAGTTRQFNGAVPERTTSGKRSSQVAFSISAPRGNMRAGR
jgi:hypothetical protein